MQYHGPLFGHIPGTRKYFDTGKTSEDWDRMEAELIELRKDRSRLDWLQRFLQMGGTSVSSQPTCQAHEDRSDDTEATRWNHPFSIGYQVEVEHRGCYEWRELSNGTKSLRLAVDAAQAKHSEF